MSKRYRINTFNLIALIQKRHNPCQITTQNGQNSFFHMKQASKCDDAARRHALIMFRRTAFEKMTNQEYSYPKGL